MGSRLHRAGPPQPEVAADESIRTDLTYGRMVGEYSIECKLGQGGFGEVYQAVHPVIGKRAAVKILHPRFSAKPEIIARFVAEARAANQIRHHNIVDVFSFGVLDDGRHYFVMELLEGAPLEAYLERRGRLEAPEVLALLEPVARALDAAHAAGIAHRDLKPENVFLQLSDDGQVYPRLLDFGVAKLLVDKTGDRGFKTRTGIPVGSPRYMSPEQCQGHEVDHRTDVYAFGIMTHRMLAGSLPFEAQTAFDQMLMHVGAEPPRVSSVCPEVPASFDEPILRMLAKRPEERFSSMIEAWQALEAAALQAGADRGEWAAGPAVTQSLIDLGAERRTRVDEEMARQARTADSRSSESALSTRARWILGVGGIAGIAIAIAMVVPLSRGARDTTIGAPSVAPHSPNAVLSAQPQPADSTPPPQPSAMRVTVRARPTDAEVYLGDVRLGVAPGPFIIPAPSGSVQLTVRAPGHQPSTIEVEPGAERVVGVALKPSARPASGTPVPTDLEYPY